LSTDGPDRVAAKATIVGEGERLRWCIWNGNAKNAQRSIDRIRKVMHVFNGEHRQGAKGVASRKLWQRCMRSIKISEAQPHDCSTMPSDSVPVCASERRSPRVPRTSWSTGA
jgi:hypothetical protein